MPDKKLTDKEIVKALEICSTYKASCKNCPAFVKVDRSNCKKVLIGAKDLINRLQAENERLKDEVSKARRKALLEATSKFAGHSDYHGDTILCKLICMAEGKEVKSARPLDKAEIKTEAYKEFANELKCRTHEISYNTAQVVTRCDIDNLLKELIGE